MLPLVVEPAVLEEALLNNNLLLVDICSDELYTRYHLPGAVHVSPSELIAGTKPAVGKLPSLERLQALFSRIGYTPDKHIVVYDDEGGGWAGRFIWTLDVIGHQHYSYLNGGIIAWAAEERTLEQEVPESHPSDVTIKIDHSIVTEKEDILAALKVGSATIWDARSAEEYAGTRVAAARSGHIPGAINLDWVEVMDRSNHMRLRSDLAEFVAERGFSDDQSIITHCQTHHRSGLTYLVGKILGLNIKAYHGSWAEWGNDPDTPISTGGL